jgi:hypothetical protein
MWPEPAHLTIGMWFDRPSAGSGLSGVCDALVAHGATFNGAVWSGPADITFSWLGELPLTPLEGLAPAEVAQMSRRDDGPRPYRVGMNLRSLGPVAVTFDGVGGDPVPAALHPVVLLMEADAFGIPRHLWSAPERQQARRRQRAVLRCMEWLCQTLDPAYAVLGVEQLTPVPARLAQGESLGWDAYISRRVEESEPRLSATLSEVAGLGRHSGWARGTFYSGWFLGDPADREGFRSAWTRASTLVGRAVQ